MSNQEKHARAPGQDPHEHEHAHDDDLIVVPKGRSRLVFFLTLALMVFVLLIFTVGSELVQTLGGRGQGPSTYLTWRTPQGGLKELSDTDYVLEKRALSDLLSMLTGQRQTPSDDQTAYWIVLDDVARDAGVTITDQELGEWIVTRFGGANQYHQFMQGQNKQQFEAVLRRQMRFERYRSMITAAARQFDPIAVEKRWKGQHQEYRFEYVQLPVADLEESARAELPGDEDLRIWFEGFDAMQKQAYQLPAAVKAEVAVLQLDEGFDASKLLEKYPGPEVEDLVEEARDYYQGFSYVRFKRENPDLSGGVSVDKLYLPFEEVEERALAEAPVYRAMTAWNNDLLERVEAGEEIDLAAEAAELGLVHEVYDEPLTTEEWAALDRPWADRTAGGALTFASPGIHTAPIVGGKAMLVARVTGKLAERQPAFAEVRERVVDDWVADRAQELAIERLDALRDGFGMRPPEGDPAPFRPEATSEAFNEVCSAAGYEVKVREWRERTLVPPPKVMDPIDAFLGANAGLFSMRVGTVPAPGLDRAQENAFLARVDGVRDPESASITPKDVTALTQAVEREASQGFESRTFTSQAFMRKQYDMWLRSWDEQPPVSEAAEQGSPR